MLNNLRTACPLIGVITVCGLSAAGYALLHLRPVHGLRILTLLVIALAASRVYRFEIL